MPWQCFMVEETGRGRLSLRRLQLRDADGNAPEHFHQASVDIGEAELRKENDRWGAFHSEEYKGDERWPTKCEECDYVFTDEDIWQVNQEPLYRRVDGEPGEWGQRELPVGAMFDAWWQPEGWKNATDGLALTVVLPPEDGDSRGRFWNIDGAATGEGRVLVPHAWTRTGTPPKVTVTPSIQTSNYHSFLTDGVLGDG